ncbi:MAG: hypothetical protein E5X41_14835 [Mesorhizobium sp.]|nr:MAG: hypothetical protein E5X41_14835 [Mesorhizobium sp.]
MKRGPGAHVLARKGTYEKLEGQLEMNFRPPKEDLYAALYGGRQLGKSNLITDFLNSMERQTLWDMVRHESLRLAVTGRATFPMPPQQIRRAQQDAERGIQMVDFRGRVYPQLTEALIGRRAEVVVLDDIC